MPNRKTARSTPTARGGFITVRSETPLGDFFSTIGIDSAEWFKWLSDGPTFAFEAQGVTFTVRSENRARGGLYYTAYKKIDGKLRKQYIGPPKAVTGYKLNQAAEVYRESMLRKP